MNKLILKRWLIFIASYLLIFVLLFKTLKLTAPFLLALLVTTIIYKPSLKLKNEFKFNSNITSIISVTVFYLLIITVFSALFIGLGCQIKELLISIDTTSLTEFFQDLGHKVLSVYNGLDPKILNILTENWIKITSSLSGIAISFLQGLLDFSLSIVKNIPYAITVIAFTVISTFFMLTGALEGKYDNNFIKKSKYWDMILMSKNMIFKYCGSFMLIVGMSFIQILILLLICKVPNALLIAVLSAILDVLPIVGMAIILIPLGLYYIYIGAYFKGIIIIIGYLLICLIRQVLEPKIMATTLNISPLSSIMAIFIGLTANGFVGMLFCIFFVVFINVLKDFLNGNKINNQNTTEVVETTNNEVNK